MAQVASQHSGANEIIGALREAAQKVKALGDENKTLQDRADDALEHLADAKAEGKDATSRLAEWSDLLRDFRSGIRDRDELIENTVGRYG